MSGLTTQELMCIIFYLPAARVLWTMFEGKKVYEAFQKKDF